MFVWPDVDAKERLVCTFRSNVSGQNTTIIVTILPSGNYTVMQNGQSCNLVSSANDVNERYACNVMLNRASSDSILQNATSCEQLNLSVTAMSNVSDRFFLYTFTSTNSSGNNNDYTYDDDTWQGGNISKPGDSGLVSCGPLTNIPARLPYIVSVIYNLLKIAVPIILIVFGMLDLLKAVMAQKEDEIKKGQHIFIKRLIAGAIVFFIMAIVQLLIGVLAEATDQQNIISCMRCFLNNKCD